MPKILVLGATGFLGSNICRQLRAQNNIVYGLARSSAKARSLSVLEIIPVTGDISSSSSSTNPSYLDLILEANIDVVIDASGAMDASFKLLEDLKWVGAERLTRRPGMQKLGFVYTSGMWVHGDSLTDQVGDLDPVGLGEGDVVGGKSAPAEIVAWRPKLERLILEARDVLDVMVLRPAMMYGGTSPMWGLLFEPVLGAVQSQSQKAIVKAEEECVTCLAHVDDVALAYVKAVEKVHLLAGTGVVPIFDLLTSRENLGVVVREFARSVGFKGELEFVSTKGDVFAKALSTSLKGDSSRAKQILGWQPLKTEGFAAGMEIYANAFVAGQQGGEK